MPRCALSGAQGREDVETIRAEVMALAESWRRVLADDPTNARPIITSLLIGRVTITPTAEHKVWEFRGKGTLAGLFTREICRKGFVPTGTRGR